MAACGALPRLRRTARLPWLANRPCPLGDESGHRAVAADGPVAWPIGSACKPRGGLPQALLWGRIAARGSSLLSCRRRRRFGRGPRAQAAAGCGLYLPHRLRPARWPKVPTAQGAMPRAKGFKQDLCADMQSFSLHAAVRCCGDDRQALDRRCRYRTRPPCRPRRARGPAPRQAQTVHWTVCVRARRWPTSACRRMPPDRWC